MSCICSYRQNVILTAYVGGKGTDADRVAEEKANFNQVKLQTRSDLLWDMRTYRKSSRGQGTHCLRGYLCLCCLWEAMFQCGFHISILRRCQEDREEPGKEEEDEEEEDRTRLSGSISCSALCIKANLWAKTPCQIVSGFNPRNNSTFREIHLSNKAFGSNQANINAPPSRLYAEIYRKIISLQENK